MRFLVVGCGGIGGIVAAHLFEQRLDVTALTTNALIADAIEAHGFRVRGDQAPSGVVRGRAVRKLAAGTAPFDYILLCTQPPQVEEAARQALPFLRPEGAIVCLQNGLCEERVAAIAGPERVLGAIVAWGASMVEPGVYDRTSAGGFVLGRLDPRAASAPAAGSADPRLDPLSHALEAVGPTSISDNLLGARWSKLAINCAISSLGTVGGERLGVLMRHRFVRRLALEIMTEVVDVARASGVRLEKVSGTLDLDWIALTDADRARSAGSPSLFAKHALLLAVGARYRRMRSSMLAAIERAARRRSTSSTGRCRRAARGWASPPSTPPSASRCWPSPPARHAPRSTICATSSGAPVTRSRKRPRSMGMARGPSPRPLRRTASPCRFRRRLRARPRRTPAMRRAPGPWSPSSGTLALTPRSDAATTAA
ncbi:MAG: 2-dehydropantoate 2-reductase N-terminal domain-containing protein [Polyangiaceae bacterium]